jgi:hypothetical protein
MGELSNKAKVRKYIELLGEEGYLVFHNHKELYPELEKRLECATGQNCGNCRGENTCTAIKLALEQKGYNAPLHTEKACRDSYEKDLKELVKQSTGKVPLIECMLNFNGYLLDSIVNVEMFRTLEPDKIDIFADDIFNSKTDLQSIEHRKEVDEWAKKVLGDIYGMQPIIDVTDDLEQTVNNYKNFADVKSGKKRVYAIMAPRIDKWKRDEHDFVKFNEKGYPEIDTKSPAMRFYAMLCAPYKDKVSGMNFDHRFTGDHEILDVFESLTNPNSKYFIQEPSDKESKKYKEWKAAVEFPKPYGGVSTTELTELRKKLGVPDKKSLFFITAEPEKARETINLFVEEYNALIDFGITKNPFRENAKNQRLYDDVGFSGLFELVKDTTHDLVPHSVIGSFLKNHEDDATVLISLAEEHFREVSPRVRSYLNSFTGHVPPEILRTIVGNLPKDMQTIPEGTNWRYEMTEDTEWFYKVIMHKLYPTDMIHASFEPEFVHTTSEFEKQYSIISCYYEVLNKIKQIDSNLTFLVGNEIKRKLAN